MSSGHSVGRARAWRLGFWGSVALVVLAVLSLAPFMTSSTELVRMRNALLVDERFDAADDWTPPAFPPEFKQERESPYPEFSLAVERLGLASMANDWERSLAISKHLLGSSPVLTGEDIKSDLRTTYKQIVERGEGYCGDMVDVFIGLASAAGMTTRPWAFSFDGFGGHGHIWLEVWNRDLSQWQLVDIYNNFYFSLSDGKPLSAFAMRRALNEHPDGLQLQLLYGGARPGYEFPEKAWDYYQRGLPQWYGWQGANVFSYDKSIWVHSVLPGVVSRSIEQLEGILAGVSPKLVFLVSDENREARQAMLRLRSQLHFVAVVIACGLLGAAISLLQVHLAKREARRS